MIKKRHLTTLYYTAISSLLCSCAVDKDPNIIHRMPVDKVGDFDVEVTDIKLPTEKSDNRYMTAKYKEQEKHIKAIMANIDAEKKRKVLVFIHGGLGTQNAWTKSVASIKKRAEADGFYPIVVTWRSGVPTSLMGRYFYVRNGVNRSVAKNILSSPFYITSDLLRGVASIPEAFVDQGSNLLKAHSPTKSQGRENSIIRLRKYKDQVIYTSRGDEIGLAEQSQYVIKQAVPGVLRAATTPIVEGAGDKVWNVMYRRARFLTYRQLDLYRRGIATKDHGYLRHTNYRGAGEKNSDFYQANGANGAAAQLIRALSKKKNIEITLVGHSMGAIVANDLVEAFPKVKFKRIIHMASADSNRNLLNKTFPYLKRNPKTKFWNLCLHPGNEATEQAGFGAVPEGSLLIWLDYFFVNPETTLERRAGRWTNVKWIIHHYGQLPNAKIKVFGLRDNTKNKNTDLAWPIKHGDFSDRRFWRRAFYAEE